MQLRRTPEPASDPVCARGIGSRSRATPQRQPLASTAISASRRVQRQLAWPVSGVSADEHGLGGSKGGQGHPSPASVSLPGRKNRPGSTISGLRGVRLGRKSVRGRERRRRQEVTGRPLRPPSVRLTTERPRSLPATARPPPSRAARGSVFAGGRGAGLSHGRWLSQHTPRGHTSCIPGGGWRGAAPPLTPNRNGRQVGRSRRFASRSLLRWVSRTCHPICRALSACTLPSAARSPFSCRSRFSRQPSPKCRTAFLMARGCRAGVRGMPPARGFRNAKTHLAPRNPPLHGNPRKPRPRPRREIGPRLAENPRPRDLSFAQIVQSITRGIE